MILSGLSISHLMEPISHGCESGVLRHLLLRQLCRLPQLPQGGLVHPRLPLGLLEALGGLLSRRSRPTQLVYLILIVWTDTMSVLLEWR